MKHRYRLTTGFTLLEALISIAIIAVLAALAYVGLGKIRESANQVKCLSNIRQVGLGITSYLQDNRMFYPKSFSPSGPDWRPDWRFTLVRGGYLGEPDFNGSEDQSQWRPEWFQVMGCPTARELSTVDKPYSPSYTINGSLANGLTSQLMIDQLHKVWLVTEGKRVASGRYAINAWPNAGDNSHPSKIHRGETANVLFCDGSIRKMKVAEFPTTTTYPASDPENWTFWYGGLNLPIHP